MSHPVLTPDLLTQLADAGDDIESARAIPAVLVAQLKQRQLFSLLLSSELGGPEMDYPDYLRVVQAVASVDGSTGWCVNQGSVLATLGRLFAPTAGSAVFATHGASIANGPPVSAEMHREQGGYRVTGHWQFSSGINHAEWLGGVAPLKVDGKTEKVLWAFFPREQAEISDSWHTGGLRGTGSHEFRVDNLFVPAEFAIEATTAATGPALYQIPMNLLFACGFACVGLGVSRAALDFAIKRARSKIKRFDREALAASLDVQSQVGRAEALWRSADSFLHTSVASVWSRLQAGNNITEADRITLRVAGTHVIRQSMDVTDMAYTICSTDSIFTANAIQRRFQDMHVITQHLQGRPEIYSVVGRHVLGLPLNSPLV